MNEVSDRDLLLVIKDFLEMGHVDNIVAMFHREPRYFAWTGSILEDARFTVRLGVSVLFEALKERRPEYLELAVPSLLPLLDSEDPLLRGEAVSILGIIGTPSVRVHIEAMTSDRHPQVAEVALDVLAELDETDFSISERDGK